MVKLFPFAFLLALLPFGASQNSRSDVYKQAMNYSSNERGNCTLDSLKTSFTGQYRLYHYDDVVIDEVGDNAFAGAAFKTLVLTNAVTHISDAVFENAPNIKNLKFTGSEEEYQALGLTHEFEYISYYSVDEGFINYWNKNIRPDASTNICNISQTTFGEIYDKYKSLDETDLDYVNSYVDKGNAKISDSMKELINHFKTPSNAQKNDEWNQTGAITLIIFIAVLGMTSITVFFLLKTKHIIN